jgi:hypothetical protein
MFMAALNVHVACNPFLETLRKSIPSAIQFVLSSNLCTLSLSFKFVAWNFGHNIQDVLALTRAAERHVPKITVHDILKARADDKHVLLSDKISLDTGHQRIQ